MKTTHHSFSQLTGHRHPTRRADRCLRAERITLALVAAALLLSLTLGDTRFVEQAPAPVVETASFGEPI